MKKTRFLGIVLAAIMLLTASAALLIGCDGITNDGVKVTYSVTVLDPDDNPCAGLSVSWNKNGSAAATAVTGADGKASVELAASSYEIIIAAPAGFTYTPFTVGASLREPTISLERAKVTYKATVVDAAGSPAAGVKVTWSQGADEAGSKTTDANGVAECELVYGEYLVTVDDLPEGSVFNDAAPTATGDNPEVSFRLDEGATHKYSVSVKSEGGLVFKHFRLSVYQGELPVTSGYTDDDGVYTFDRTPGEYTVRAAALAEGYSAQAVTLTEANDSAEIVLHSEVISTPAAASVKYVMGSIIHDYSFTTPYEVDGSRLTLKISEILKEKDAILINNWGTQCSWCVKEMPAMEEAYQLYKDDIELIAVSNYQGGDSDSVITSEYQKSGYSFPMVRDTAGLATKFALNAWPSTIVIDRYGAVARIESGAILDKDVWGRLIEKYIGDDYVQTFTPGDTTSDPITSEVARPDVTIKDDHYDVMEQKLNNTAEFPSGTTVKYSGEPVVDYWPFLVGKVDGVSDSDVVYASSTGKANTMAILYAEVNAPAGKVLTFDYYADTEEDTDIFSVIWDNMILKQISGNSNGWQTCNLYTDLDGGEHSLAFAYVKDSSTNVGKDNVYIRNVRFVDVSAVTESADMLRPAAYGELLEAENKYSKYATVAVGDDKYYHVMLDELENSEFAGNDSSPLLFANLLNVTKWSNNSVLDYVYAVNQLTGEFQFDFEFTVNGVTKDYRNELIHYLSLANNSDIHGFVPVDAELKALLVEFAKCINDNASHPAEWLELCYYYSHYGDGDPVANPIMGLSTKTAIPVGLGTHTADVSRIIQPFPITIYSFTPETSGVYRIHSLLPADSGEATQIWLYDDETDIDHPLLHVGDSHITLTGADEHNFDAYRYMDAGHTYYLALAFQMSGGTFEYEITAMGASHRALAPAASRKVFYFVLDENGNLTGEIELAGAVKYVKDSEGYFHAVNPDGTTGGYIYLDVKYANGVIGNKSITQMVDSYEIDPGDYISNLEHKMFDFTKRVMYRKYYDAEGNEYVDYAPETDVTGWNDGLDTPKYVDSTARMKEIIASAPASGEEAGFVRVDQELADILKLLIEMRLNSMYVDDKGEIVEFDEVQDNEWLRFCWYYRLYDENNK